MTGRYNQIRLHFAHHDHALVGERKYARGKDDPLRAKRVALHALAARLPAPRRAARRVEREGAAAGGPPRAARERAEAYSPGR